MPFRAVAIEATRLGELSDCRILDTPPEESFDEIARLAANLCGTPMAGVSFVASERQWFKARVGLEIEGAPRQQVFCAHALDRHEPLIIEDARLDTRFQSSPFVVQEPSIRFYAGVPLWLDAARALGTLCVFDHEPRRLSSSQLEGLSTLARHVTRELRLRRELSIARMQLSPSDLMVQPGDLVGGRWRLVRPVGEGTLGVVFEAVDPQGERVAIKMLRPRWLRHPEVVERFVREARILMQISCPHVVRIADVGNLTEASGGAPFLVMDFLRGVDLAQRLNEVERLPWREAVRWARQLCLALSAAHAAGVVHRDIKPANVFLAQQGGRELLKLVDFGIARELATEEATPVTQVGSVLGSMFYMSPEQVMSSRRAEPRSDLWAVGVLLYELLTGRVPFDGQTPLEVCMGLMTLAAAPMGEQGVEVPPRLEALVMRCLEREPSARPASALALADELARMLDPG